MADKSRPDRGTAIIFGYNQFLCAEYLVETGEFSLSEFEELNRLIEAVVLYDQIVLLGEYRLPSGILADAFSKAGILQHLRDGDLRQLISRPETQQFFLGTMRKIFGPAAADAEDAQAAALLDLRISPNESDRISYNAMFDQVVELESTNGFDASAFSRWLTKNVYATRDRGGHFYYVARALVYSAAAQTAGMDYAPDVLRLPVGALSFAQGTRALSKALYDALVEKVHSEVEALTLLGMPVALFIPPLTAKVLSEAGSTRDYPNHILALRDQFVGFRKTYNEFLSLLKDPEVTIKEKIAAKERLFEQITGVIERGEAGHALNVRTLWDKLVSSQLDESGPSTKVSLSGLVSLLIDQAAKERTRGRARALFDLWADTLNMKNYGALIEKAFKTKIESGEVEALQRYSRAIRSIIRSSPIPQI